MFSSTCFIFGPFHVKNRNRVSIHHCHPSACERTECLRIGRDGLSWVGSACAVASVSLLGGLAAESGCHIWLSPRLLVTSLLETVGWPDPVWILPCLSFI